MSSDDEKWASIVKKEDANANGQRANSMCLKQISPDELNSLLHAKRTKRPKRRSSNFFVTDTRLELTSEDMKLQMNNTSDTLNQEQIPVALKEKSVMPIEKFDKLIKTPERPLSSTLERYYAKNLKPPAKASPSNDFDISYEEIQKNVDRFIALRNHRKDPTNHRPPSPLVNKEEPADEEEADRSDYHIFGSFSDFKRRKSVKRSTLENIDNDFKPTINLSTRTYTRKKPPQATPE